jgi:hypothetical protein
MLVIPVALEFNDSPDYYRIGTISKLL